MNVLLTSVGRRSYLVEYFKQAVQPSGKVIAANSEALTSGMISADKSYAVSRVDSEDYISEILNICKLENVGLVVSLFDIDLPYLAESRQQFIDEGIELIVSDPWVVDISNDKWKAYHYFCENKITTPKTFISVGSAKKALEEKKVEYPLIIKPRWGMGSISIFRANNEMELDFFYSYAKNQIESSYLNILSSDELESSVVIQECIFGNEYGLDVFNDLTGNYIQTVAKQKIAMRSGETDIARLLDDERLQLIGVRLSELLRHRGNVDVDVLEDISGKLYVLEINARFGGGYPFSHVAGADFPAALVAMAEGREVKKQKVDFSCVGLKELHVVKAQG